MTAAEAAEALKAKGVQPCEGAEEFTLASGEELDVSVIGGYPVRSIVALAAGTVRYRDAKWEEGQDNRTFTAFAGEGLFPTQITSIRGTSDGSSAIRIRVYK